jgi:DNA ligase-associated metallophosphoesterase
LNLRWVRTADDEAGALVVFARSDCGALWIELMGTPVALRPSGALWVAGERTLVAGDLHLEKGSSYAAKGQLLPPYDTVATLDRLEAEIAALDPRTMILLGDSFHDPRASNRLHPDDARRLSALGRTRDLIWVEGNHDARDGESALGWLPGEVADEVQLGGLILRHEPLPGDHPGEVSGHLHPCAKVVLARRGVRRRAFATDGRRLILPAFGAFTGGLNLCDPGFSGLFAGSPLAAVLGSGRVHPIPFSALRGD